MRLARIVALCALVSACWGLSCIDDSGSPVAWFVMLKYPKGCAYLYSDSNNASLDISPHDCGSATDGALAYTLAQVYSETRSAAAPGIMFYNDQPPPSSASRVHANVTVSNGHSKGVVAWSRDAGFWIVHSFPEVAFIIIIIKFNSFHFFCARNCFVDTTCVDMFCLCC